MFARVSSYDGPAGLSDDEVQQITKRTLEDVMPGVRQMGGFRGILSLLDRASGKAATISLWDTEADMQASEEAANAARAQAASIANEEIVLLSHGADVPDRCAGPEEGAHVVNRPQLRARHAERDHRGRMAVHHGHDVGPGAIDLAVDVALDESLALVADRFAVRAELHDVGRRHQRRRARARHEEMPGPLVAARAHMSIGVEHAVPGVTLYGSGPVNVCDVPSKKTTGFLRKQSPFASPTPAT